MSGGMAKARLMQGPAPPPCQGVDFEPRRACVPQGCRGGGLRSAGGLTGEAEGYLRAHGLQQANVRQASAPGKCHGVPSALLSAVLRHSIPHRCSECSHDGGGGVVCAGERSGAPLDEEGTCAHERWKLARAFGHASCCAMRECSRR